jgi:type II secretory pathway component PulF
MNQATPAFPAAAMGAFGLFFVIYMIIVIGFTVTMFIAFWRIMRAHENIAERMGGIERAIAARSGTLS